VFFESRATADCARATASATVRLHDRVRIVVVLVVRGAEDGIVHVMIMCRDGGRWGYGREEGERGKGREGGKGKGESAHF
jgi:hypothetical protein